ncbi:hypothetical protein PHSY_002960 [Pseudozyma hubeiensis SY62]|uniref:Uncharacterized protein n=1 Tax=Pseudozyma hubeiensis (strain SY62) TaxID=1305764 RepID=R9PBF2_PSEHS|nr:hypothetical protein PHSY_002960 [Pseudozyma hubeiensis SY62]GAC95385.1 hypothetical protein PHSY_002960 [Pseudozyma hubeiensis SY62]
MGRETLQNAAEAFFEEARCLHSKPNDAAKRKHSLHSKRFPTDTVFHNSSVCYPMTSVDTSGQAMALPICQ